MQRHIFAGFVLIFIMSLLVGGATAAYFSDEVSLASMAKFVMGTVDIEVDRVPGQDGIEIQSSSDIEKAQWVITNTGSQDVLLRAKLTEDYKDEIDTVISRNSASISCRAIDPGVVPKQVNDGWEERYDGYFYYIEPVESGCTVEFDLEFTVDGSWWGEGELYLEAEALQASNLPLDQKWPDNTVTE
jgi:predicted ribosomally synthesized peptide with SipW-like signal peptide